MYVAFLCMHIYRSRLYVCRSLLYVCRSLLYASGLPHPTNAVRVSGSYTRRDNHRSIVFFPKKSYFFLRKKKKHCLSVTGHDRLPVNNFPKIVNVLHSLVPVLEIVPGHENKTQGTQLSLYSTLLFTLVGYLKG